jgi:apolipoprotein N-acyltransferase
MAFVGYLLLAAVGGALVFLSFPPWDWFPLAWVALAPLLWTAERVGPGRAFLLGWAAGFVTNLGGFHWMHTMLEEFGHQSPLVSWPLTCLMATYQGLVYALATGIGRSLTARVRLPMALAYPLTFVAAECLVPFLFPWYLANSQYRFPLIVQVVDLFGVAGLSLLLVLFNATLARVVRALSGEAPPFPVAPVLLTAGLVVAALGYGVVSLDRVQQAIDAAPSAKVGMVEANVGIWEKEARHLPPTERRTTLYRNLLAHQAMSRELEKDGADLIVWPESSYVPVGPTWVKTDDRFFLAGGRGLEVVSRGAGEPWVREPLEDLKGLFGPDAPRLAIRAIWADRDDRVFLAGDRGLLLAFDGTTYKRVETGLREDLRGVSGTFEGVPYLAGSGGGVYRVRGGAVETVRKPQGPALNAIARLEGGTFLAVGDHGTLLRLEPGAVRTEDAGTGQDLLAVDPPYAVGAGGLVLRRSVNGSWRRLAGGDQPTLRAVRSLGGGAAVAVGDGGTVLVLDGDHVRPLEAPTSKDLHAAATFGGTLLLGGDDGLVLVYADGQWKRQDLPLPVDVRALRGLDYYPATFIPRNVRWIYRSEEPLPEGQDPQRRVEQYLDVPAPDRDAVQRGFDVPTLLGIVTRDEARREFRNTAVLLDRRGRVEGIYDKNYLLMFGEYLPLADKLPFLRRLIPEAGDFVPGETVEVFPFRDQKIGVMVCYEDIIPAFTRRVAGKAPNLLVNITNDAWFGRTAEPWLHLALAVFRAVENRRFLVRSTNTGVSAFVDPMGRILRHSDLENPEVLMEKVAFLDGTTLYQRLGDVLGWGASGLAGLLFVASRLFGREGGAGGGGGSGKGGGRKPRGTKARGA